MISETPAVDFYGHFGRFEVTPDTAALRVYPFGFASGEDTPVLEITIRRPAFSAADLTPLIDGEIEVMLHSDRVQVDEVYDGDISLTLTGESVHAVRSPYDLRDYAERLAVVDAYHARDAAELRAIKGKIGRLKSVAAELIRRAELKAGVSHDVGLRQAGVIEALQRILAELEMDG